MECFCCDYSPPFLLVHFYDFPSSTHAAHCCDIYFYFGGKRDLPSSDEADLSPINVDLKAKLFQQAESFAIRSLARSSSSQCDINKDKLTSDNEIQFSSYAIIIIFEEETDANRRK